MAHICSFQRTVELLTLLVFIAPVEAQCELARLLDPAPHSNPQFGGALALAGGMLFVGDSTAPVDSLGGAGVVYVYGGAGWSGLQVLSAEVPEVGAFFGSALASDGPTLVVGASETDGAAPSTGAVHVFVREAGNWVHEATLTADDGVGGDRFGSTVAIEGSTLVVGAYNGYPQRGGALYVFERAAIGWKQTQKLRPQVVPALGLFAQESLVLRGDLLVVGAPIEASAGPVTGAVHVFRRGPSEWTHEARLTPSDGGIQDAFGVALDVCTGRIVVGAPIHDNRAQDDGEVYVFDHDGSSWIETARLVAPDPDPGVPIFGSSNFGQSVACEGDHLAVGAPGENFLRGALYFFERVEGVWRVSGKAEDLSLSSFSLLGFQSARDAGVVACSVGTSSRDVRLFESSFRAFGLPGQGISPEPVLYGKGCPSAGGTLTLQVSGGAPNGAGFLGLADQGPLLVTRVQHLVPIQLDGEGEFTFSLPLAPLLLGHTFTARGALLGAARGQRVLTGGIGFTILPGAR